MTASPKSWIFSSKFYHKSFIIFTFAIWIFKISEPSLCIVHGKVTRHFFSPTLKPKGTWHLLLKCPFFLAYPWSITFVKIHMCLSVKLCFGTRFWAGLVFHPWAMPHYLNYGAFRINVSIPSCVESSAGFICKIILGICGVLHSPRQSTISISAPTMKELGEDFNSDFTKYLYWFQGKYYLHNILLWNS